MPVPIEGVVLSLESERGVTVTGGTVTAGNNLTAAGDPVLMTGRTPTAQPALVFDGMGDLLQRVGATDALAGLPSGSDDRTMFFVVRYVNREISDAGLVCGTCRRTRPSRW